MSSPENKEIILSRWKKSVISDDIHLVSKGLPPIEHFADIRLFSMIIVKKFYPRIENQVH